MIAVVQPAAAVPAARPVSSACVGVRQARLRLHRRRLRGRHQHAGHPPRRVPGVRRRPAGRSGRPGHPGPRRGPAGVRRRASCRTDPTRASDRGTRRRRVRLSMTSPPAPAATVTPGDVPDREHLRQVRLARTRSSVGSWPGSSPPRRVAAVRAARSRSSRSVSARASVEPPGSRRWPGARMVGLDLPDAELAAHWAGRTVRGCVFADIAPAAVPRRHHSISCWPSRSSSTSRTLWPRWTRSPVSPGATSCVSVPREPIWRAANMARGKYLGALGNTPGPRQPLVEEVVLPRWSPSASRSGRFGRRSHGRWCPPRSATDPTPPSIWVIRPRICRSIDPNWGRLGLAGRRLERMRHAEVVELGDHDAVAVLVGDLVGRVDPHLVLAEGLLEAVVGEQPPDQRIAEVEDQLDRLDRLDATRRCRAARRARRPRRTTAPARPAAARGPCRGRSGPCFGSNTVTMPSKRKIDPCTTGMPSFTDASFTRNRVGKLSVPSTTTS